MENFKQSDFVFWNSTEYSEYLENVNPITATIVILILLSPTLLLFLVPVLHVTITYTTLAILSVVFVSFDIFRQGVAESAHHRWDKARQVLSVAWSYVALLWHGYETEGLQNVPKPDEGGAVLVFYNGALPIDRTYLSAKLYYKRKQMLMILTNKKLYAVPGFEIVLPVIGLIEDDYQVFVDNLKAGHIVAVSPGESLEALFGGKRYRVLWEGRNNFAKAALEAKVPIIPVFTQNIREAARTFPLALCFTKYIYRKFNLPLVFVHGGLPVQLRTHIGEPLPYDPDITPGELVEKTKKVLEDLIARHQRIPGNIVLAFLDRIRGFLQTHTD